jgi:uncharacterized protein
VDSLIVVVVACVAGIEILYHLLSIKFGVPIFEGKPPFAIERYPSDPSAEQFSFPTSHGLRLQGTLFRSSDPTPRGLILFCHEFDSNRWSARHYCQGLLDVGFDVMAFDFRNQGDSDDLAGYEPLHWTTTFEVEDVLAAITYIDSRADLRDLPLGLFGVSRGGGAAIAAAAQSAKVRCVVSDGAYSAAEMLLHFGERWGRLYFPEWFLNRLPRWHLMMTLGAIQRVSEMRNGCIFARLERALGKLKNKPVLMLSGERDTYVIPKITLNLHSRTNQSSDGVWIVPGAKHNMARQVDRATYDRRLVEFFSILGPRQKVRAPRDAFTDEFAVEST